MRKIFLIWPAEIEKQSALYPPLGLSSLNTVLKKHNYQTEILDLTFDKNLDCINNLRISGGIYCVSVLTPSFNRVKKVIEMIKGKDVNALVILGGPHPTIFPKESLKNLNADIVCIGEGEKSLVKIMQCLKNRKSLKNIDGIAYKKGNKIIVNPKKDFIENIDEIPLADQGSFDIENYFKKKGFRELSIITTRGCPGNCTFCQPTLRMLFGSGIRRESPKRIVDEIEWLVKNHELDLLVISDDSFGFYKETVKKVCQLIIKRKINVFWRCQSRIGLLDPETLKLMKKSGCVLVAFGVESGSQQILNELRKGIAVDQIKETFRLCRKVGILTHAYIMIGSPGDSDKTLRETIDLIKEIKPFSVNVSITTPYPGTCLYNYLSNKNMLVSREWEKYDHILPNSSLIKGFSEDKILQYRKNIEEASKKYSTKFYDIYRLVFDLKFISRFLSVSMHNPFFIFRILRLVIKSITKKGFHLTNPYTKA